MDRSPSRTSANKKYLDHFAGISWNEKVCQQVHNVTKSGNIEMNLGFVTHLIY